MATTVGQEFVIVISITMLMFCSAQSGVRGPPQADIKEMKKVGRIGDNIKLVCPIVAFPPPMIEWSKNGEKIDYMWERHRTSKKSLKIKNINEDDTGIFTCKGINGFGSEDVRIELIVVDPRVLPPGSKNMKDVTPPVFTYESKTSQKTFTKAAGETFKVSCEALGSPQPEIFWFKNGHHIDRSVRYQRGKSTVEFSVMGGADAGVYTCRARNLIGEKTLNFTLDVKQPKGAPHAIVTEAGPTNTTVMVGEEAALQCKVKSIAEPHIKWLKKLESHEALVAHDHERTLRVGQERYRILDANPDVSVGNDEYLNKLLIQHAALEDAGLYICFVTNGGFGALTYKSMTLRVQARRPKIDIAVHNDSNEGNGGKNNNQEPIVYIIVVCLAVIVAILLFVMISCVCVRRQKHMQQNNSSRTKDASETQSSTDCSSEVGRPFMPTHAHSGGSSSQHYQKNNNLMINKPLPPTPMTLAQWSSAIHPSVNKYSIDSGYNDNETGTVVNNQYEVPYAHLLRPYRPPDEIYFTQEAFLNPMQHNSRPTYNRTRYFENQ